jgi:hypothetical protein|uniref:Uncharacterized protein n=1 Tax=viral metagenome TaxID=1070528 RepID=A0A6C0LW10_9ZZZZ
MSTQITFYYDPYEKSLGDGNYPQLKKCEACSSSVEVEFKKVWIEIWSGSSQKPLFWIPTVWETEKELNDYRITKDEPEYLHVKIVWKQMNWDTILGLDGTCGPDLFRLLEVDTDSHTAGIVNLNKKFIYTPTYSRPREEAISTIIHHTAMPYVMGGSLAKYQGMDATMEYLEMKHSEVFTLLSKEEIIQIIQRTIGHEQT